MKNYEKLTKLYNLHKSITQLSWYLNNIHKKYPFEDIDPLDTDRVDIACGLYDSFYEQLEDIYIKIREERFGNDDPIVDVITGR